jgi:DNA topoisomerase I
MPEYYVHPAILDAYLDGSLIESLGCASESHAPASSTELRQEQKCIVKIIRKQAKTAAIP